VNRPTPIKPGPGQESVWDYPRPPRLEAFAGSIVIELGGVEVARTTRGWKVLETSHPPTYYVPRDAFLPGSLREAAGSSFCEWKGQASYFDVLGGPDQSVVAARSAWTYPIPTGGFTDIAGTIAVMAAAMDRCLVDDEVVTPQPGGFYGGWITSSVVGPFKGIPGSMGW
jgi:uncharacterized protein (DUF427 family)